MSKTARTPRERGIGVKGKGSEMGDRIQRTAAISAIRTRLIVEKIVSFWNIIPPFIVAMMVPGLAARRLYELS